MKNNNKYSEIIFVNLNTVKEKTKFDIYSNSTAEALMFCEYTDSDGEIENE